MQIFCSNLNVPYLRGARATPPATAHATGARAAGVAILLFIYVEIFTSVYRLDTSLLIFQMQISHLTTESIMQSYLHAPSALHTLVGLI